MNRRNWLALAALAGVVSGCVASYQGAPAPDWAAPDAVQKVTPPPRDPADLQVLFWDDSTRQVRFAEMEKWFPGHEVTPAAEPRELAVGEPLSAPLSDAIRALMEETNAVGVLVLDDGVRRFEHYRAGFGPQQRWTSFSMAKSFTSTLLGAALREGFIASLDDSVAQYIPEMKGSVYEDVTVEQLAQMTSGVAWNEDYSDPASDVAQMNRFVVEYGPNAIIEQMRRLKREAPPGTKWVYKTGETNLLGIVVENVTGMPLARYAKQHIVDPAGFEGPMFWMTDPRGGNIAGCCISLRLADYARFGQFVLEGASGHVPEGWWEKATRPAPPVADEAEVPYGYQWWIYPRIKGFGAQGIFGQSITIIPHERLVITVLSNWPRATSDDYRARWRQMAAQIAQETGTP